MIDYVRMSMRIAIPDHEFQSAVWREYRIEVGTLIRYHRFRGVWIRYYPESCRMTISGKLLMLLEDSEVLNVDDVYECDIPRFIDDLNGYINALFLHPVIDVSAFHVTRLDYCYNVKTPYVQAYLCFLAKAFLMTNARQRINYTQEKGLTGSVYVKTNSDYKHNERRNYVLNFYDKTDRLRYLQRKAKHAVADQDWAYAQGVLRLEIQCGIYVLKQLCRVFGTEPLLVNLLRHDIALYAEATIYGRVFHCDATQDYYSYDAAKRLIPARSGAAMKALLHASQGHRITGKAYDHGRKVIKESGVYPFCFLPRGCGLDTLENPIRLIYRKLVEMRAIAPQATEYDSLMLRDA